MYDKSEYLQKYYYKFAGKMTFKVECENQKP